MLMVAVSLGIVIFAHGSSIPSANDAVKRVAAATAAKGGFDNVETAFLEANPTLAEAVGRLAARGAKTILIVPYFLTLGIHLQRDLPGMVEALKRTHQDVEILVSAPLDGHPALVEIVLDRVQSIDLKAIRNT